jgi:hypothetical protein
MQREDDLSLLSPTIACALWHLGHDSERYTAEKYEKGQAIMHFLMMIVWNVTANLELPPDC